MKFEFPDTGEGVTEGKFLEWKVEEGEEIEEDQVVGEAETDKAVVEIPSPADGTVKDLKVEAGDMVEVGEVIMELDAGEETEDSGENHEAENRGTDTEEPQEAEEEKRTEKTGSKASSSSKDVLALPKVRKLAEEKSVNLASIKTGERITEEEVMEATGEPEHTVEKEDKTAEEIKDEEESSEEKSGVSVSSDIDATPAVRKLAREKGVDIGKVKGSGRGGKVTRADVLEFNEDGTAESSEPRETVEVEGDVERVKMNGVKRKTAEKVSKAKFNAPHVTHIDTADVTSLVELHDEANADLDSHLTYLPFIMKACYLSMQEHPDLNAELDEKANEIVRKKFYNFNIAVDTERGLLVPKVEGVDEKSLIELAKSISQVVRSAENGELSGEDMKGGTFSITNIGAIGGESFTPIINYPHVAILGVGKIEKTAEVIDGEVVPRNTVKLSLSYDHRVIDGAEAAKFMNKVIEKLEKPEEMLLEV